MSGLQNELFLLLEGEAEAGGGFLSMMFPLLLMLAVFYFILIRPQSKEKKAQAAMRAALKKGDLVLTQAGIIGTLHQINEREVVLDLDGKSRMRLLREAVIRRIDETGGDVSGGSSSGSK